MGLLVLVISLITLLVLGYSLYQLTMIKSVKRIQLQHESAAALVTISNQHNLDLLSRWQNLPPAMPSWQELDTARKWEWRVLFFNHLNVLKLAWQDIGWELMDSAESASWIEKARFWFKDIRQNRDNEAIQEGREILKQILQPEEGYPREFCGWLVENGIINNDLMEG